MKLVSKRWLYDYNSAFVENYISNLFLVFEWKRLVIAQHGHICSRKVTQEIGLSPP